MPSPPPAAALPGRYDRFLILGAVCLAGLVLPLSFTAPPVAIPAIAAELGGSPIALNWMTNAFMLAFGSCLMAAGTLADTYGRKRVFSIGIVAYAVVSLLLALAPNLLTLNALRVLQGVAAALALAGGNAALSQEFHGPARIRAFSLLGTAFGLGLAFGPSLAGWLVQTQGWRAVFLSSLAIAVLATVFGVPRMRESRDPDAARLDLPGSLSSTAMLALLTIGVLEAPERGWSPALRRRAAAADRHRVLLSGVDHRVAGAPDRHPRTQRARRRPDDDRPVRADAGRALRRRGVEPPHRRRPFVRDRLVAGRRWSGLAGAAGGGRVGRRLGRTDAVDRRGLGGAVGLDGRPGDQRGAEGTRRHGRRRVRRAAHARIA
ncbi:MAG: MFS transporter [Lysobacter sp.]|nr:MFS transporter [Lysobacter sp.]